MLEGEKLCILKQNFQARQNPIIWNPVPTIRLPILQKPETRSFKRDTFTKNLSQSKSLEERKKLRFILQNKDRVLHSLVQTWTTF